MPAKRRKARPFTAAELEQIRDLLSDGAAFREIGRTLDRHPGNILRAAKEYGWQSVWSSGGGPQVRILNNMLDAIPAYARTA